MAVGPDSAIYMFGYTANGPNGNADFMLAKISLEGMVLWTQFYGTSHNDFGASVAFTSDGNLLMAGTTHDPVYNDQVLLILSDTAGNEVTSATFGTIETESVNAAKLCPDHGFLVAGYQTASGTNYAYMLKTDSLLNEQWSNIYGIGINDYASEGLMVDPDIYYLASDRRFNTGPGSFDYDISLIRTDSAGNMLWDSVYHADFQNGSQGLIRSQGGHLLVFGETEIFQFSPFDYFIFATDTSGNLLWRETFGGSGTNALFDLIEDSSGNLVGTGYGNSQSGGADPLNMVILKTDPFGNLLWQKEYGLGGVDIGYRILASPDGGYLVAGRATTPDDEDFYLLKTDDNGLITGKNDDLRDRKGFVIFPNPSIGMINFRSPFSFDQVRITDISGSAIRILNEAGLPGTLHQISLPDIANGIYFIELYYNAVPQIRTIASITR